MKGVLRIIRDGEVKLTLPSSLVTIKSDGSLWCQGMPILGAPTEKKPEMSKLVKAGRYKDIPSEYYTRLGYNASGVWAVDDEAWDKHPAKLAIDKREAEKEIERKKIVKIYLSSRGWGDYSSLEWVGDITKSDQIILAECRELLVAGRDVDKPNQSDDDILKRIKEARARWSAPPEPVKEVTHGPGYCYSCETYCCGACRDYQPNKKG